MITFYLYMNINEVISFLLLIRLVLSSSPLNILIQQYTIRIYPPIKCLGMFPPFRPSFLQNHMHHFFLAPQPPQQLNTLCVAIATTKDEGLPPLP